jgi:hypothetical protein
MKMFATVKRIKVGKIVEDKFWRDSFIKAMQNQAGTEIQIVPSRGTTWFDGTGGAFPYSFHKSWLKNFRMVE